MMRIENYNQNFDGVVGNIEAIIDCPENYDRIAIICHPNPLFGGTNKNKVTATLARTLNQHNVCTIRPNFRGIGNSAGEHDYGTGETDDILLLIEQVISEFPTQKPITLSGFSFGAFVISRVINKIQQQNEIPIEFMILAGIATSLFPCDTVSGKPLVVHGEKDEIIPLESVFRWAEPQEHAVTVVAGADHFFSKKLHILKRIVSDFIS